MAEEKGFGSGVTPDLVDKPQASATTTLTTASQVALDSDINTTALNNLLQNSNDLKDAIEALMTHIATLSPSQTVTDLQTLVNSINDEVETNANALLQKANRNEIIDANEYATVKSHIDTLWDAIGNVRAALNELAQDIIPQAGAATYHEHDHIHHVIDRSAGATRYKSSGITDAGNGRYTGIVVPRNDFFFAAETEAVSSTRRTLLSVLTAGHGDRWPLFSTLNGIPYWNNGRPPIPANNPHNVQVVLHFNRATGETSDQFDNANQLQLKLIDPDSDGNRLPSSGTGDLIIDLLANLDGTERRTVDIVSDVNLATLFASTESNATWQNVPADYDYNNVFYRFQYRTYTKNSEKVLEFRMDPNSPTALVSGQYFKANTGMGIRYRYVDGAEVPATTNWQPLTVVLSNPTRELRGTSIGENAWFGAQVERIQIDNPTSLQQIVPVAILANDTVYEYNDVDPRYVHLDASDIIMREAGNSFFMTSDDLAGDLRHNDIRDILRTAKANANNIAGGYVSTTPGQTFLNVIPPLRASGGLQDADGNEFEGKQGAQGRFEVRVYIDVAHGANVPAAPSATSFDLSADDNPFTGLTNTWSDDPPASRNRATRDYYSSLVEIDPSKAANNVVDLSSVAFSQPEKSDADTGATGARGLKGDKGDDAFQSRFIFQNATSQPATPTTVTINADGTLANIDSGYSSTYVARSAGQITYIALVTRSSGGAITRYAPIPLTGDKGDKGDSFDAWGYTNHNSLSGNATTIDVAWIGDINVITNISANHTLTLPSNSVGNTGDSFWVVNEDANDHAIITGGSFNVDFTMMRHDSVFCYKNSSGWRFIPLKGSTTITFPAWVSGTVYAVGQGVRVGTGSSTQYFVCIEATTSSDTTSPENDSTHWKEVGAGGSSSPSGSAEAIKQIFYGNIDFTSVNISRALPQYNGADSVIDEDDLDDDDQIFWTLFGSGSINPKDMTIVIRGKQWKDATAAVAGGNDSTSKIAEFGLINTDFGNINIPFGKQASGIPWIQTNHATQGDAMPLSVFIQRATVSGEKGDKGDAGGLIIADYADGNDYVENQAAVVGTTIYRAKNAVNNASASPETDTTNWEAIGGTSGGSTGGVNEIESEAFYNFTNGNTYPTYSDGGSLNIPSPYVCTADQLNTLMSLQFTSGVGSAAHNWNESEAIIRVPNTIGAEGDRIVFYRREYTTTGRVLPNTPVRIEWGNASGTYSHAKEMAAGDTLVLECQRLDSDTLFWARVSDNGYFAPTNDATETSLANGDLLPFFDVSDTYTNRKGSSGNTSDNTTPRSKLITWQNFLNNVSAGGNSADRWTYSDSGNLTIPDSAIDRSFYGINKPSGSNTRIVTLPECRAFGEGNVITVAAINTGTGSVILRPHLQRGSTVNRQVIAGVRSGNNGVDIRLRGQNSFITLMADGNDNWILLDAQLNPEPLSYSLGGDTTLSDNQYVGALLEVTATNHTGGWNLTLSTANSFGARGMSLWIRNASSESFNVVGRNSVPMAQNVVKEFKKSAGGWLNLS